MRVIFMGTPEYAVPTLRLLQETPGTEVVGVYTPPDRPRGRGRNLEATPVKGAALEMGLPIFQPSSLRSTSAQVEMARLEPDVAVVAAYGKFLPAPVLRLPSHGCLNIHPSLLPKYRGPSPVASAILDGAGVTGVTLMLLDEGMDSGPVIAQKQLALEGAETAATLTATLFSIGGTLLLENLEAWIAGRLEAIPQDHGSATVTRKLERADGLADWQLSAAELERRSRAFTPWPGFFADWQGKMLRLLEVVAMEPSFERLGLVSEEPGLVQGLALQDCPLGIGTSNGILGVKTLQLEGRRVASAAEFLRGYPAFPGSRL